VGQWGGGGGRWGGATGGPARSGHAVLEKTNGWPELKEASRPGGLLVE